jgi:hypothetical protein
MTLKPIKFNEQMFSAIMRGSKTQTRRPLKSVTTIDPARYRRWNKYQWAPESNSGKCFVYADWAPIKCPYGTIDDEILIKDTDCAIKVSSIRIERLQDISEADAKAEGCEPMHLDDLGQTWKTYQRGFQSLWEMIYGGVGPKSWDANPWVWVIEFKRLPVGAL